MTCRPFFEQKRAVRMIRTETGFDIEYTSDRVYIYGLPELRSLCATDMAFYVAGISEPKEPEEDIEEVVARLEK